MEQMKDRIRQLMLDKAMSQKSFASELCIAEATLSGIFNGRTRPTNQTVNAIHECFPELNISWLMFGEGEMYLPGTENASSANKADDVDLTENSPQDLFSTSTSSAQYDHSGLTPNHTGKHNATSTLPHDTSLHPASAQIVPQIQYIEKIIDKPQRKITEIRIFFDDGTYETFTP